MKTKNRMAECREGLSEGRSFRRERGGKETPEKSREKEKFHVLPYRFVYRTDQRGERIPAGPVIEKVGQGSEH